MGEEFGVKRTGLNRDVPHAGGGIREPDLTLGGEETWPWRKGKKGCLRLWSLGRMGNEEKGLCHTTQGKLLGCEGAP